MTVYEKLSAARVKLQSQNIRKSGNNKFAGYTYFDLSDILPAVNLICNELKVATVVNFSAEMATLDFVNAEKPDEKITFSSPMSTAALKGCHAVQNLGAVETYIKRYLYQNCFEIAENDSIDSTTNFNRQQQNQEQSYSRQTQQYRPYKNGNNYNNFGDDAWEAGRN